MQMTALCWDACVYKLVCSVPRGIFLSSITLNDKTDTGPRSVITDPHTASVSVFSQCLSYSYVPDLKLFSYLWSLIFSVLLFSPIILHRSLVFTHTSSASLDPSQYLFSVSLFSLGLIQKALTLPDSCTHTHRHSVAARLFQEAFPAWRVSCSVFWRHIPHLCTVTVNGRLRSRAQTTALVFTFSFSVWAEWVTRRDDSSELVLFWKCLMVCFCRLLRGTFSCYGSFMKVFPNVWMYFYLSSFTNPPGYQISRIASIIKKKKKKKNLSYLFFIFQYEWSMIEWVLHFRVTTVNVTEEETFWWLYYIQLASFDL